jgi:IS1 family transposase
MDYLCVSPESEEIVAFDWGSRDIKTAKKLRNEIKRSSGLEKYTVGIEGNNCRLRRRVRRVFFRTCYLSKRVLNHREAFTMVFFYINYGFV